MYNYGKKVLSLTILFAFCIPVSLFSSDIATRPQSVAPHGEVNMATTNEATDNNFLLVDGSHINGNVLLIEFGGNLPVTVKTITKDAKFFNSTSKGDFIYENSLNKWLFGNVKKPELAVEIPSVLEKVTFAALSPNGEMMVSCLEQGGISSLVLGNMKTGLQRKLISESGVIRAPSWSPKSNSIAYYYGPSNVQVTDEFTLKLATLAGETKQLAASSQPTGITADRADPPQWSPDGVSILFVANYESDYLVRSYAYSVRTDGTGLKRVGGGVWSADGTHLLSVRSTKPPFGSFVLSVLNLSTGVSSDINIENDLPMSASNGRWKSDGKLFAFITNENELYVVDVRKRQKSKLVDLSSEGSNLIWIE